MSSVMEDDERDKSPLPQQKERGSEGDRGDRIGKDTKDAAEIEQSTPPGGMSDLQGGILGPHVAGGRRHAG